MEAQSVVAITAVVVTGIVAVLNGFVPFLIDWRKAEREEDTVERQESAAQAATIDQTTIELLGTLSHFAFRILPEVMVSYDGPAQQACSELRAKHYAWERSIWSRLEDTERQRVRALRSHFESMDAVDTIRRNVSSLSDEVLSVTYIASKRA